MLLLYRCCIAAVSLLYRCCTCIICTQPKVYNMVVSKEQPWQHASYQGCLLLLCCSGQPCVASLGNLGNLELIMQVYILHNQMCTQQTALATCMECIHLRYRLPRDATQGCPYPFLISHLIPSLPLTYPFLTSHLIPSLPLTLSLPYLSPYPFLTSHLIPSLSLTLSLPYLSPYPFLTSHLIPSLPLTLSLPYLSPYPFVTSHLIPSLPLTLSLPYLSPYPFLTSQRSHLF